MEAPINLIHGDCVEVMRSMDPESIDAIVTDPPYELGFMGKSWDARGIANDPKMWAEALRVLKPGGHLLAFGGTRTYHRMTCAIEDAGFEIRDCLAWLYGSGFPKSKNLDGEWQGWGTALKPAHEPIVVARKPLIGTVAKNVETYGTGALNVDGCRIGTNGEVVHVPQSDPTKRGGVVGTDLGISRADVGDFRAAQRASIERTNTLGRWPANVLLDEEAAAMLDEQSGERPGMPRTTRRLGLSPKGYGIGVAPDDAVISPGYGDTGGASRFFYTAKASRKDRGEGNTHPTVKPTSLMRWLLRLVVPPNGLVLDPFAGSGTTGVAARAEGFDCVLIEREAEYLEIIRRRLAA